jgi:hypothetical protein
MATTKTTTETPAFDPAAHLVSLKGKDYLEVKWRLVWLRTAHPDAIIETDCVSFNETFAVFKARVALPSGAVSTGWGSEEKGHFGDYIEKAETKAIGRALGALGFGTQFADDFSDAGSGRIADAPVTRTAPPRPTVVPPPDNYDPNNEERRSKAMKAIFAVAKTKKLLDSDIKAMAYQRFNVDSMTAISVDDLAAFWTFINSTDTEDLMEAALDAHKAQEGK